MADVKVERKESISRDDAARWLSQLARAFGGSHDGELPFAPATVSVEIPDQVRAELEVEVKGNEVEIEIEFKWLISEPEAQNGARGRGAAENREHDSSRRNRAAGRR
jgi:amphi-Trp domain-containing protein